MKNKIIVKSINAITLRFVANSYSIFDDVFPLMVNGFNAYSKENNLDIDLELTFFSEDNNTQGYIDLYATLNLLKKKTNKYDIFAYDPLYLRSFTPYLIELDEWVDKELLDIYSTKEVLNISVFNNHRYGIPIILFYSVLFSNSNYLKKHNKGIPKTWDELIDTAKYILKEEKEKYNNTDLYGYNGFFPNGENSMSTFYQLLYSYRDDIDSPLPDIKSQNAIDALNKIKQIQNEISSELMFRSSETNTITALMTEKILFSFFWSTIKIPNYTITLLPSKNRFLNSTVYGGYNIGINRNIEENRKKASIEVLKYFLSEEVQRDIILKKSVLVSPLKSLYQDDNSEICKTVVKCSAMRNVKCITKPSIEMNNYLDYSNKVVDIIHEFLAGKKEVEETLTDIDDITRIYFFSWNDTFGLVVISILGFIFFLYVISIIFLFIPKFQKYFIFFEKELWLIYSLGSFLILCSIFEYFNKPSINKCTLRHTFINIGNAMIYSPLFYRLLINFPEVSKFIEWVKKIRIALVLFFIIIQILLSFVVDILHTYKIEVVYAQKNYSICGRNNNIGSKIVIIQYLFNIFLYISIGILIFLEWNIEETFNDIRNFTFSIIIDAISILLIIIIKIIDFKDYIMVNFLDIFINILFVLTNQIYIVCIRVLILKYSKKKGIEEKLIDNLLKFNESPSKDIKCISINSKPDIESTFSKTSDYSTLTKKIYKSKILNYHYSQKQSISSYANSEASQSQARTPNSNFI
ncbi:periplasmic binding protein-like II [Anaeromyces robustus]|uniref:Periplasmic binding protein-like II n=1 Tax=Anaeromyces robustus TaxID=1754192 RepID=A0A1Y1VVE7_9FUNG|nr:periplasmic binding protein-like II [Anaeromyces robustus]|eukprot:ORX64985.1 periplasmic binding protein-like II [Anaeromyces robustus]